MKVKVSYGCELSSVPSKVKDMLKQAEAEMAKQFDKLKILSAMIEDEEFQPVVPASLDALRKVLNSIDLSLADAQSIFQGYVNVIIAGQTAAEQRSSPAPAPVPVEAPIEGEGNG